MCTTGPTWVARAVVVRHLHGRLVQAVGHGVAVALRVVQLVQYNLTVTPALPICWSKRHSIGGDVDQVDGGGNLDERAWHHVDRRLLNDRHVQGVHHGYFESLPSAHSQVVEAVAVVECLGVEKNTQAVVLSIESSGN